MLLGGYPFRVLRLSAGGSLRVQAWFSGDDEPRGKTETDLAARLVDSGLAHPSPAPAATACHVVIPFHGHIDELQTTLAPLRGSGSASITVVDDGSEPPIPALDGVTVLRHEQPRGPAAARNTGWRYVATSQAGAHVIVFVDGGVVTPADGDSMGPTWLEHLAGHLVEERVAAVAPRVASTPGPSLIDRYEAIFSPLDLGPAPSLVGPGRLVTYVPTACLMVRLADLANHDGFDETLRYGEDVDLIWRMSAEKHVRYDPTVVVEHEPRSNLRAFARQRFGYATAAAGLDQRHPTASAPWRSSLVGVAGVALFSLGHPVAGTLVGFGPVSMLADRLEQTATPMATSLRLLGAGHRWALRGFAESMGRSWCSGAAVLAVTPVTRTVALGWMLAGWARRAETTRSPLLLALGVVDDVSYGVGATVGALRQRSARSLLPTISRWG